MGTNATIDTLGSALFGKTRQAIPALFFTNIESSFYLRQVAQILDCGMGAVQRELANLAQAGILNRRREGRQVYFNVNKSCPIYNELMSIVKKTSGLAGLIKQALDSLSDQIEIAFIFGSFAKTHQTPEGDIDLFLIGDAVFPDIVEALRDLLSIIDRDLKDCQTPGLSNDWRFNIAYNAALQCATVALAASGYRATRDAHHYRTIHSLELTISDQESKAIIDLAVRLRDQIIGWLMESHPDLVPY